MLFNSFEFLLFFPAVTAAYFALPYKWRPHLLLLASCVFYMAFVPKYILVLGLTIVIDYFAGIFIENSAQKHKRRYLLWSIAANVGVLAFFKYFHWLNVNIKGTAAFFQLQYQVPILEILLPIGLSFHTFQAMSYTIEVYRGDQKAERNFIIYALYVMFYPQLVAGPIERPQNMLHQFHERHDFNYQRAVDGLKLMAWGLFKKAVIADRLAIAVNAAYGAPQDHAGFPMLLATVLFAFQIFCDFSGYSDIAIGSAQVMGFDLMTNFNRPYWSRSIAEFWQRWHISLSTWFRDYVFIPIATAPGFSWLGGDRAALAMTYVGVAVIFLLSGLWHGSNRTFVVWGLLNGFYMICSLLSTDLRRRFVAAIGLGRYPVLHRSLQVLFTFSLTCFAWIFFRANSMTQAWQIIAGIGAAAGAALGHLFSWDIAAICGLLRIKGMGLSPEWLSLAIGFIVLMECVHLVQGEGDLRHMLRGRPAAFRWAVYYSMVVSIFVFGVFGRAQFIYFQF